MCGIAGWIDGNINLKNQAKTVEKMSMTLQRRGPDAEGIFSTESCVLIHRRLTVVDAKGGLQPMVLKAFGEEYIAVYNGELYNTSELRDTLMLLGWSFDGYSDSEVLLKAYVQWGEDCIYRLNGILAFAVWERHKKRLFIARDRIGIKPVFFSKYSGGFVFGSEIKTLMANYNVKPEFDDFGLKQILLMGPGRSPGCGCIKGVEELLPGEYLVYEGGNIRRKRYWKPTAMPHKDNLEETLERTRTLITDSIERQTVSDVPLACLLSGGLDSSIISMVVAKKYAEEGRKLTTYSVDYEGNDKYFVSNRFQPDADRRYIEIMREFIGSEQRYVVLDNMDVARAVTEAADARDLPGMGDVDSSLLLFCKEIKKNHTVCMSGECADELFGGYPWYHNEEILFTEAFPWSNSAALRKKLFKAEFLKGDCDEYLHTEYKKIVDDTEYLDTDSSLDRRMREMFMLNFYSFMQTLVDRSDRMSMHNGVEVRVPLCDYRIVEYAYNMPWHLKSLNGREKGIMREAFKDLLPYEIIHRKKSPYPKTYNPMFFKHMTDEVYRLLSDKASILGQLVNRDFLDDLTTGRYTLENPWYGQLMRVPQIFAYLIQTDRVFKNFGLQL